jgi:Mor family transcriptional regulator
MSANDSLGTQLVTDMVERLVDLLTSNGLAAEDAREMAVWFAEEFQADWGGIPLYFPRGLLRKLSRRDQAIYERFNGRNLIGLAREEGLTERQIRKIVAKGQALDRKRRQTDMFGD